MNKKEIFEILVKRKNNPEVYKSMNLISTFTKEETEKFIKTVKDWYNMDESDKEDYIPVAIKYAKKWKFFIHKAGEKFPNNRNIITYWVFPLVANILGKNLNRLPIYTKTNDTSYNVYLN